MRVFKRIIIITLSLIIIMLVGALFFVPRMMIGPMINMHVDYQRFYEAETYGLTSERIALVTADDIHLEAYYVEAINPIAAVIFLTGIHNPSVTAFYGHAKMMYDENISSILLEVRAHGESDGDQIGLGYREIKDVIAAVNHLKFSPLYEDKPIIVFGLSMGGAVAINAFAHISDISLLISLSAYSSFEDVFIDQMRLLGFPNFYLNMQKPFVQGYLRSVYGKELMMYTPIQSISKSDGRKMLLMHSEDDSQVPYSSFIRLKEKANPNDLSYHSVSGDHHFILPDDGILYPYDHAWYQTLIMDFIKENL